MYSRSLDWEVTKEEGTTRIQESRTGTLIRMGAEGSPCENQEAGQLVE